MGRQPAWPASFIIWIVSLLIIWINKAGLLAPPNECPLSVFHRGRSKLHALTPSLSLVCFLRHHRKQFYEAPPPASIRESSPHGFMFRLVFAVCPVNIRAAALQVSEVELDSGGVLKHLMMRKQIRSNRVVAYHFLCVCVCLVLLPPAAVALPPALRLAVL